MLAAGLAEHYVSRSFKRIGNEEQPTSITSFNVFREASGLSVIAL
jgi:hypothetical protein